jgi:hypothetical protein
MPSVPAMSGLTDEAIARLVSVNSAARKPASGLCLVGDKERTPNCSDKWCETRRTIGGENRRNS